MGSVMDGSDNRILPKLLFVVWEKRSMIDNLLTGLNDTDVFDEKGNFSAPKFEELFKKYDLDSDGALSKEEFLNFRNRNKESTAGAIGSKGEFDLLVKVAGESKNETKVISKERMLDFYNGSLFYKLAGKEVPSEK